MKWFAFLFLLAALGAANRIQKHLVPSLSNDGTPRRNRSHAVVGSEPAAIDDGDQRFEIGNGRVEGEHVQQRAHAFEDEDEQWFEAVEDLVKSEDVQQDAHTFRLNLEDEHETFYECDDPVTEWNSTLADMYGDKGNVLMGMTYAVVRNLKFFCKVLVMFKDWAPLVTLMPVIEDFLVGMDGTMETNLERSYIIPNIPYYKFFGEVLGVKERSQATASTSKGARKEAYDAIVTALHKIMARPDVPLSANYWAFDGFAAQLQKLLRFELFGKKVALYIFETFLYYALFATEEIADRLEPEKVAGKIVREYMASDPSLNVFLSMAERFLKPIQ